MTANYLQLSAQDPIVARDGRPFGVGQGYRMKGLEWPYPSVVAGSFRTALVKTTGGDFTGNTPRKLMGIQVAGVFPVAEFRVGERSLYLPAPNDCVVEKQTQEVNGRKESIYTLHPAVPADNATDEGCDWPGGMPLRPVLITKEGEFKPGDKAPAWWPVGKIAEWLISAKVTFDNSFLLAARSEGRDHVQLEAATGAAAKSRLFATAGLNLTHLPRFGVKEGRFAERYANITLSARVEAEGWNVATLNVLHPLGGERRLVHWQANGDPGLWHCPAAVRNSLAWAERIRMVLATPAVFSHGWRPQWIDANTLEGTPPG